jgi:hypothetical protein
LRAAIDNRRIAGKPLARLDDPMMTKAASAIRDVLDLE